MAQLLLASCSMISGAEPIDADPTDAGSDWVGVAGRIRIPTLVGIQF